MSDKATNLTWHAGSVTRREREQLLGQKGVTLWMTGLSASGKSTIACILEHYQDADGSVTVPDALRPYLGTDRIG